MRQLVLRFMRGITTVCIKCNSEMNPPLFGFQLPNLNALAAPNGFFPPLQQAHGPVVMNQQALQEARERKAVVSGYYSSGRNRR